MSPQSDRSESPIRVGPEMRAAPETDLGRHAQDVQTGRGRSGIRTGANACLWRHPDAQVSVSKSVAFYRRQAQTAETGKFNFLVVADSHSITARSSPHYLNRFEPITILSALAASTSRIDQVATLTRP